MISPKDMTEKQINEVIDLAIKITNTTGYWDDLEDAMEDRISGMGNKKYRKLNKQYPGFNKVMNTRDLSLLLTMLTIPKIKI